MHYRIKIIDQVQLQTTANITIEFVEDHKTRLIISLENGDKFEATAETHLQL